MYQTPPHCIVITHVTQGHVLFSCLPLPHLSLSNIIHYVLLALFVLSIFLILVILLWVIKQVLLLKNELAEKYVLLEVIPPSYTKQTTFTTEQFMTVIHGLGKKRSFLDTVLGKKKTVSLELVSNKNSGIRYCLRVPSPDETTIKRQLLSFLPGVEINRIEEYLLKEDNLPWEIKELHLAKHYVYPLQEQKLLSQYDPIAYFTGHMTQLKENEMILMQLVLTPVISNSHPKELSFIRSLTRRITNGEDITPYLQHSNSFIQEIAVNTFLMIPFILLSPFTLLGFFLGGNKQGDFLPFWLFRKSIKKTIPILTPEKQTNQQLVLEKIKKELFEVSIRIYVSQIDKNRVVERMDGLVASFQTLHTSLQELKVSSNHFFFKSYAFFKLSHRLLPLRNKTILSASEIANMYHFPYSPITHTEDLVQNKTQELPVPLSIKNEQSEFAVTFGVNSYGGQRTTIGLTKEKRHEHMYVIGGTNMGKSTLLQTMINQDIANGEGVGIIDPHGELITNLFSAIPEHRYNDVIVFDPDDTQASIGLNILSLPENLTKEELPKYKDAVASTMVSLFAKLFPLKTNAHRMEHILRMSVLTALETKDPTLFTIQKLLTEYDFRKQVIATLKDPILLQFWKKEFNGMGSFQRSEAITPITSKLGKFLSAHLCRNILLRKKSTINFTDIMDKKKIFLCNLSKGKIGEDMSSFFGALITAHIQLAALQRARIPREKRTDFYLYIDEFQNFATPSFAQILSEARKYGLCAILAHQTVAQIEDKSLIEVILANVGTIIALRTGSPLDEEYLLPSFIPEIQEGQISGLPKHHFYIKIKDSNPQNTFTGETIKQEQGKNPEIEVFICELSRKNYAIPKAEAEKEIEEIFGVTTNEVDIMELLESVKAHYL